MAVFVTKSTQVSPTKVLDILQACLEQQCLHRYAETQVKMG